jgi:hypothetical protein
MTRDSMPILLCDGEDGDCDGWIEDFYGSAASAVNGVRLTATRRAPGWRSVDSWDFCPVHADGVEHG